MTKKLRAPINPRNMTVFAPIMVGLLGLFSLAMMTFVPSEDIVEKAIASFISSLGFFSSFYIVMAGFWAGFRLHALEARYLKISLNDSLFSVISFTMLFAAPLIMADQLHFRSLSIFQTILLLAFGIGFGLTSEHLVTIANKDFQLQMRGLKKIANSQEMMINELAAIASISEEKVQRALGREKTVPAKVAREWLEKDQGIKCPPIDKKNGEDADKG